MVRGTKPSPLCHHRDRRATKTSLGKGFGRHGFRSQKGDGVVLDNESHVCGILLGALLCSRCLLFPSLFYRRNAIFQQHAVRHQSLDRDPTRVSTTTPHHTTPHHTTLP